MIEWSPELSVKNEKIDAEHQTLIAMINELQGNIFAEIETFKGRISEDDEGLMQEILFFLQKWFISHIKKTDKEYIPYLGDS